MRNKVVRNLLIVLLMVTVVLLTGCGKPKEEQASTSPVTEVAKTSEATTPTEQYELQGEYAIDLSNLGMALTFYLKIDEDNNFILSPNRQFTSDRGTGTIGELEGTYLMIYSDSTPEKSKTATFERIGHNLIFRSPLPYGTTNIMFEAVDSDDPEIVYHLMANKFVYEEYYDTYLGFMNIAGEDYEYVLNLGPGATYHFASSSQGENPSTYEESGHFRVHKQTIFIKPQEGEELQGSITPEGGLNLLVKPSAEADPTESLLRVATTAKQAGTWYAQANGAEATLNLDYFGGYTFTVISSEGKTVEKGTFTATQDTITFIKEGEVGEPKVAKKENYTFVADFDGEWTFYDASIQGEFTGATMVAEAYTATLKLNPDGSYELAIIDQGKEDEVIELLRETGTFSVSAGPMAYVLTLTSADFVSVGEIWGTGLNMTFELDGTSYNFMLTK